MQDEYIIGTVIGHENKIYSELIKVKILKKYPFTMDYKQMIKGPFKLSKLDVSESAMYVKKILLSVTNKLKHRNIIFKTSSEKPKIGKKDLKIIRNGYENNRVIDLRKDTIIYLKAEDSHESFKRKYSIKEISFTRRGHFRKLKNGKEVWVNATTVNRGSKILSKKYKI